MYLDSLTCKLEAVRKAVKYLIHIVGCNHGIQVGVSVFAALDTTAESEQKANFRARSKASVKNSPYRPCWKKMVLPRRLLASRSPLSTTFRGQTSIPLTKTKPKWVFR